MGANGRLLQHNQAKIVDPETGEALPPMKIDVGDEEAAREIIDSDRWLKTGDLGYFDEDGFLFLTDRMKELIKYNAHQVAPAKLEQILQSYPAIPEAAVIPYPDDRAGQVSMAFIVKDSSRKLTESEVKSFFEDLVAPCKRVRRVSFVDSIPKNTTGKVLRKDLLQMALSPKSKI